MADVLARIVDQTVQVTLYGSELIAPLVEEATDAATAAAASATAADTSADAAAVSQTSAASSATSASASQAVASAAASTASAALADSGILANTFATKAAADAALGGIAANAFVQVVVDETRDDHRTLYRKTGGVLVFHLDLTPYDGLFVTLEEHGGVGDGNPTTGAGTINDAAMTAALAALQSQGGGTLLIGRGCYRFTTGFELPTDGSPNANDVEQTHPIVIKGVGCHMAGQAAVPEGGSILMWTASSGDGRIEANGEGYLRISDLTMLSREGTTAGSGRPFIYHTNATLHADRICAWTLKSHDECDDDFVVSGGTSTTFATDATAPFQGYSTIIERCYFSGIRRGWYARTYCNANRFINNTWWRRCGSNLAAGSKCALEIDGDSPDAPDQFAVSNVVAWNLFEIESSYEYGIQLRYASYTQCIGNEFYDAEAQFIAGIRLESMSSANHIVGSLVDNPFPLLSAATNSYTLIRADDGEKSKLRALQSGEAANPNSFGPTTFTSVTVSFAPTDGNTGSAHLTVKQTTNGGGTGNTIFEMAGTGAITWGADAASAGNVANPLAGGASFQNNARTWACTGSGGNMRQNSGTGGSTLSLENVRTDIKSHTGTQQLRFGAGGPGGEESILFGSASDTGLYRASAECLRATDTIALATYTVATLPAAAAGIVGARAFVSDASGPTFGSAVAGGGAVFTPVYCTGSAWNVG
jgi:hypothetical protein